MFNEQVKREIITINLSRHNQAMASPQMMQFKFGSFEQTQPLSNPNARTTSSLLDTSIPKAMIWTIRPPRATAMILLYKPIQTMAERQVRKPERYGT